MAASRPTTSAFRRVVAVGLTYLLAYQALFLYAQETNPPGGFSPWFPPAGAMFTLLLLFGWRWTLWAIVVRVLAVELWAGGADSFDYVVVQAASIAIPYAVAGETLRRLGLRRAHVREFMKFAVVGVGAAPALAAVLLALTDSAYFDRDFGDVLERSRTFWVGDGLAIAAMVPFVSVVLQTILFGRPRTELPKGPFHRIESIVQVVIVVGAPLAATSLVAEVDDAIVLGLVIVPLVWVALRQDLFETAAGVFVLVSLASLALRERLPPDELLRFQYLLLCSTLVALFGAAVRRTYEDLTAAIVDEHHRYELIDGSGLVAITELDLSGGLWRPWNLRLEPPPEATPIERGVVDRWARFGPTVITDDRPVGFDWKETIGGRESSFASVAMPFERADGELERVIVVTTDRTDADRARAEVDAARRLDSATGLANRAFFLDELERIERRDGTELGVGVVSFASLLERHGRPDQSSVAGAILSQIVARLTEVLPDGVTIGRIGDFALAFATAQSPSSPLLSEIGDEILDALRPGDDVEGSRAVDVPIAVGLDSGSAKPVTLLDHAERAARQAGRLGSDRVVFFHPSLRPTQQPTPVVDEVRRACAAGDFIAHFQPIVRLDDRVIVGAEALARWKHPRRGILPPSDFLAVAESTGMIARIDELILRQSAEWLDRMHFDLPDVFSISVNLSPVHLGDPHLAKSLRRFTGSVDPSRIRFEITESEAMTDPQRSTAVLAELDAAGFTIILDDFGTGYSSMAWLHRLPVRVLKIDRSFVHDLPDSVDALRIVRLAIALARDLGLATTAEGVETPAQAEVLAELGCRYGQGHLFGRPMSADDLCDVLGLTETR